MFLISLGNLLTCKGLEIQEEVPNPVGIRGLSATQAASRISHIVINNDELDRVTLLMSELGIDMPLAEALVELVRKPGDRLFAVDLKGKGVRTFST